MRTTPALHVQTEVRGDVPPAAAELAAAKVRSLLRTAPEPVLFARVTLAMAADPAVARPAVARASLDLNGRPVRAQASAVTWREAVDRMSGRLRLRLQRAARTWAANRGGKPVPRPHEWRHESVPTRRGPYFPRPPEERVIVRHTTYALGRQTPGEAAADLEMLGYDFHLFTDKATGRDSVIYRSGGGYRMAQARPGRRPADAAVPLSERPVPRLAPAAAADRLDALGEPFLFFVNSETGHGSLIYHRYDGHYGLITRPGAASPPQAGGNA